MTVNASQLEALILATTRRVVVSGEPGDGSAAARQFDAVARFAGFKCSRDLLERLSGTDAGRVIDIAAAALAVVREQAGDHVRHNSYFLDFPENVPDTTEFWAQCLREALLDPVTAGPPVISRHEYISCGRTEHPDAERTLGGSQAIGTGGGS